MCGGGRLAPRLQNFYPPAPHHPLKNFAPPQKKIFFFRFQSIFIIIKIVFGGKFFTSPPCPLKLGLVKKKKKKKKLNKRLISPSSFPSLSLSLSLSLFLLFPLFLLSSFLPLRRPSAALNYSWGIKCHIRVDLQIEITAIIGMFNRLTDGLCRPKKKISAKFLFIFLLKIFIIQFVLRHSTAHSLWVG